VARGARHADELDAAIARLLSENGRLSNREIARRLGSTEPTIRRRVARLLQEQGFRIVGDFGGQAQQTQMVFFVHAQPGRRIEVAERLSARSGVRRVLLITGAYDLIVEAAFDSDAEALTFLVNELEAADDVASAQPGHVLKQFAPAGVRGMTAEGALATSRPDAALRSFLVRAKGMNEVGAVVDLACDAARWGFGVQDAAAVLRDEIQPDRPVMVGGQALAADIDRPIQESLRTGGRHAAATLKRLLDSHVHVYVQDAFTDPVLDGLHDIFQRAGVPTMLCLPLLIGEQRWGMLALYSTGPRHYSDDEIALAQALADQLAIAIARNRARTAGR
jgi:DNA-binding Lrp family transcriptional regulator